MNDTDTVTPAFPAPVVQPEAPPHPLVLVELAIERGLDPDKLGKLIELAERMDDREAQADYQQAMRRAQEKMPTVVRDADNKQTGSRYARFETVLHVCKPVWTGEGFSLAFSEADCPVAHHKRTVLTVMHDAGHRETSSIDLPLDGVGPKGNAIAGMNAVQAAMSTGTYAQRALVCRVFNITVANQDVDGNSPSKGCISRAQVAQINTLIDELADLGAPLSLPRMLAWQAEATALAIESLDDLPVEQFSEVMRELGYRIVDAKDKNKQKGVRR
jgi:hypothetical protein